VFHKTERGTEKNISTLLAVALDKAVSFDAEFFASLFDQLQADLPAP
jgi:hypothetical protein